MIAGVRSTAEVRAQLEERLGAVPQLKRRLDPEADPPAWVDDPAFSLDRHVIDRGALDDAGLRRLVATAMETPLDRRRPLWAIDVVSPLAGGRTALVWRIHHAMADGMTAMRMARALLLDASRRHRRAAAGRHSPRRRRCGGRPASPWRCAGRSAGGRASPRSRASRPTPRGRLRRRAARGAPPHRSRCAGARDRE